MQKKRKGFLLIEGILQIVVLGLVAVGFAALFSSQFTTLSASKTAVEARQMAELEAAYIRKIGYNDFNSADATGVDDNGFHKNGIHDKEIMTKFAGTTSEGGMGDKWYSKVSIVGVSGVGDGATVTKVNGEDGNNLKIARIEIYRAKDGTPNAAAENTSRYSLEVPLSSQNANTSQGSNIGTPDYSKAIGVFWRGRGDNTSFPYDSISNVVYLETASTYIIPNDGWIVWTKKIAGNGVTIRDYPIHYFINDVQIYGDTPIPVKKGDVISAYNPVSPYAAMEFAPNK